jgi:hypothetical protein
MSSFLRVVRVGFGAGTYINKSKITAIDEPEAKNGIWRIWDGAYSCHKITATDENNKAIREFLGGK